jgi:hypothetical protein
MYKAFIKGPLQYHSPSAWAVSTLRDSSMVKGFCWLLLLVLKNELEWCCNFVLCPPLFLLITYASVNFLYYQKYLFIHHPESHPILVHVCPFFLLLILTLACSLRNLSEEGLYSLKWVWLSSWVDSFHFWCLWLYPPGLYRMFLLFLQRWAATLHYATGPCSSSVAAPIFFFSCSVSAPLRYANTSHFLV